jgi:hypothetical protein
MGKSDIWGGGRVGFTRRSLKGFKKLEGERKVTIAYPRGRLGSENGSREGMGMAERKGERVWASRQRRSAPFVWGKR